MGTKDKYYYQSEFEINIIIEGEKEKIVPVRLKRAIEDSNYHENFFPYLQLFIAVQRKDIMKIYRNQLKTTFHIRRKCLKFLMSDSDASDQSEPELISQDYDIDEVFVPMFNEGDFPRDIRDEDFDNPENQDGDGTMARRVMETITHDLDVVLYSAKALAANKDSLINAVFKDCDIGTALGFIIDNSTCETAIVDPPDNTSEYKNLILLPYNLRNSIWGLQTFYGIYKESLIAFFDFECLYILSKYAKTHEFDAKDKQYTKIQIYDKPETNLLPTLIGESKDSIDYIISAEPSRIDQRAIMGELDGSKTMVTNYKMAIDTITSEDGEVTGYNNAAIVIDKQSKSHEKSGSKISVEYDEMNNLINIAAFNRERSPREAIPIAIPGVEPKSFKPNRLVTLEFINTQKNNELGGTYTTRSVRLTYDPVDQRHNRMICSASVVLVSVEDGE